MTDLRVEPWIELDSAGSTQDVAAEFLQGTRSGEIPGVIWTTDQRSGRGRFGRNWYGRPGDSLAMTLVLRDYPDHPKPWLVGMGVAIAAAGVLHCQLRWPNDLSIGTKKVGGILTELVKDVAGRSIPVVGVGLNLNHDSFPTEIEDIATSLKIERGHDHSPLEIAQKIAERLAGIPEPESWQALESVWMLFDATPGKRFKLPDGEEAVGLGFGPDGELICSVNGETKSVLAADAVFGV
ncbi:MAG: biotin--[acetyl-CoA-carboxylase] ligase [Fimbriimonadaceae bacterium]|nr:biotin--[acetyl-CoA-carboxylase] ligase [Fimbriimonadaceae bacterium]